MFKFIETDSIKNAYLIAPWATVFRKHNNGYMAFLNKNYLLGWKKRSKKYYLPQENENDT